MQYMNKPKYQGSIEKRDRIQELEKENERLHDVIRHLTMNLDEAEDNAYKLQVQIEVLQAQLKQLKEVQSNRSIIVKDFMKKSLQ